MIELLRRHCGTVLRNDAVYTYFSLSERGYRKVFHHQFKNELKTRLSVSNASINYTYELGKTPVPRVLSKTYLGTNLCHLPGFSVKDVKFLSNAPSFYCNVRHFSEQVDVSRQGWLYKVFFDSPPILFAQDFLVYMHNISGLSWWATIVMTTVLLRTTITLPLALYQIYVLAKLEDIQLQLKEISKEMGKETRIAVKLYNWNEKQAKAVYIRSMKKQWKKLVEKENCHPAKTALLMLVQLPMWISLSLALRNLAYMLPTPDAAAQVTAWELSGGGILWFHNLLLPDSSWILPIVMALLNLSVIEIHNLTKTQELGKVQKVITHLFRGVCIVMIPIAASVPSCLSLYWVTSSAMGVLQNLILLSPRLRTFVGIPETKSFLKHPYKHMYSQLEARLSLGTKSQRPAT